MNDFVEIVIQQVHMKISEIKRLLDMLQREHDQQERRIEELEAKK